MLEVNKLRADKHSPVKERLGIKRIKTGRSSLSDVHRC